MIHQYSLADYQLTIGLSDNIARQLGLRDANGNLLTNFSIGGPGENNEGSFVGQIVVNRTQDLFTTEGDATGSWVHNKNLNRSRFSCFFLYVKFANKIKLKIHKRFFIC